MLPMANLKSVRNSGMCIACGACVADIDTLALEFDPKTQAFGPPRRYLGSPAALKNCPAIGVDYAELLRKRFPDEPMTPAGPIRQIYLAQSADASQNFRSSSGGLVREILLHLIRSGQVSGIIALGKGEGINYEPCLLTRAEQVEQLPCSVYHTVSFEKMFGLLKMARGNVAIVALPCHIEALFSYCYNDRPDLLAKIHMTVGLLCGFQLSRHSLLAVCRYLKRSPDGLLDVTHRGAGRVGKQTFFWEDASYSFDPLKHYYLNGRFDKSYRLPRCFVCVNHTNFLADISVGDGWLDSVRGSRYGTNIAVARNEVALKVMQALQEKDLIRSSLCTFDDLVCAQGSEFVHGAFSYGYGNYLRTQDLHVPVLHAPNEGSCPAVSEKRIAPFHATYMRRRRWQQKGRYGLLLIEKLCLETPVRLFRLLVRLALKKLKNNDGRPSLVPEVFR